MDTINFNFFQLLILFGSLQGLIFSFSVFFLVKNRTKSMVFLGMTVFFLSLSNLQHMFIDVDGIGYDSLIRKLYIPWHWLVAPMFYLYFFSFLRKDPINKKKIFFLVSPFLVVSLIHLVQMLYQQYFDHTFLITDYFKRGTFFYTNLASFIYVPAIVFLMYRMVLTYEKTSNGQNSNIKKDTKWFKKLIFTGAGIVGLGMVSVLVILFLDLKNSYVAYPFFIALSCWIYWVGYVGLSRSIAMEKLKAQKKTIEIKVVNSPQKKKGYQTFSKINQHIIEEKKYLDLDVNLNKIAKKFNISSGYLSQLINQHAENSFSGHINELRVNASKKMLIDKRYENYTIESIGIECGFKSKSNFYTLFKKYTDYTPMQYKNMKKISSESLTF